MGKKGRRPRRGVGGRHWAADPRCVAISRWREPGCVQVYILGTSINSRLRHCFDVNNALTEKTAVFHLELGSVVT